MKQESIKFKIDKLVDKTELPIIIKAMSTRVMSINKGIKDAEQAMLALMEGKDFEDDELMKTKVAHPLAKDKKVTVTDALLIYKFALAELHRDKLFLTLSMSKFETVATL